MMRDKLYSFSKRSVLIFLSIGLCGCMTSTPMMIGRATVLNDSGMLISNVEVIHTPTQKLGYASAIPAGRAFDVAFASQPLLAKQAIVHWTDRFGTRRVTVELPAEPTKESKDIERTLIYTITSNRTVTVHLEP